MNLNVYIVHFFPFLFVYVSYEVLLLCILTTGFFKYRMCTYMFWTLEVSTCTFKWNRDWLFIPWVGKDGQNPLQFANIPALTELSNLTIIRWVESGVLSRKSTKLCKNLALQDQNWHKRTVSQTINRPKIQSTTRVNPCLGDWPKSQVYIHAYITWGNGQNISPSRPLLFQGSLLLLLQEFSLFVVIKPVFCLVSWFAFFFFTKVIWHVHDFKAYML